MYDCLIYIAGPISARTKHKLTRNINAGLRQAERFWVKWRIPAFSPHAQTGGLSNSFDTNDTNYNSFLTGDLIILKRCNAVYLLPGWEDSPGARTETKMANLWSKPVYESELALVDWVKREFNYRTLKDMVPEHVEFFDEV